MGKAAFMGWSIGRCRCVAAWTGSDVSRALPGRGQTVVTPKATSLWDLASPGQRGLRGWRCPSGTGDWRKAGILLGPSVSSKRFRRSGPLPGVLDGVPVVSGASAPLSVPGSILGGIGGSRRRVISTTEGRLSTLAADGGGIFEKGVRAAAKGHRHGHSERRKKG
jgi:hypothetical protein